MIRVNKLTCRYSGVSRYALRNLSFECESSGITVAVGRSGIGKSTLISLLAGMYLPSDEMIADYSGTMSIDGMLPEQLRGPGIVSWVPQAPLLLDHLSVIDNIVLPASASSRKVFPSMDAARAEAVGLLKKLDLEGMEECRPRELSGGMMTRVSLLRALISKPRYLFLDEPFVGLDLVNRWSIYEMIRDLRGRDGLSTFLTTHDIPEATVMADRILLIEEQPECTSASVLSNAAVALGAYGDGAGLGRARAAAKSIEHLLFATSK